MAMDVSGWATRLTEEMVAQYTASGEWRGVTLADRAQEWAMRTPSAIAVVDGEVELTFDELFQRALTLATALRARGLEQGDVVSFQLPNWHEALIINIAASIAALVINPIIPIYRDAEVGFILKDARTRVLFIPENFRAIDYPGSIERLRSRLPRLQHVVLVRAQSGKHAAFEDWSLPEGGIVARRTHDFPRVNPNAIKLVLYTSGTTGVPKGVLHSHNTLGAEIDAFSRVRSLSSADVVFMPSPVTHIAGYLYGMELLYAAGMKTVLMERWNAVQAMELISRHGATFTAGATPFLVELVNELERRDSRLESLRFFGCGGAPVPPDVVERARLVLPNCETTRAYGATEAPTVSVGLVKGDPVELAATTDGTIVNHEVRIVDPTTGEPRGPGQEGEIVTRGPEVMLGYTDPEATMEAFDAEGFFHTGDLGFISNGSYLTISGRKKDIIIRGGENISAKEIEDILHRHPAVLEVAVVAMPHPRMGETPCAFIVVREGRSLDLEGMTVYLESQGLAKQKFPEKLVIKAELPRNVAGKVLKHLLRAQLNT